MRLRVKKLFCVELLSECPKLDFNSVRVYNRILNSREQDLIMRNLVIARITALWKDHHPLELDLLLSDLPELSNADLLDVLEDMVAMEAEGE